MKSSNFDASDRIESGEISISRSGSYSKRTRRGSESTVSITTESLTITGRAGSKITLFVESGAIRSLFMSITTISILKHLDSIGTESDHRAGENVTNLKSSSIVTSSSIEMRVVKRSSRNSSSRAITE